LNSQTKLKFQPFRNFNAQKKLQFQFSGTLYNSQKKNKVSVFPEIKLPKKVKDPTLPELYLPKEVKVPVLPEF